LQSVATGLKSFKSHGCDGTVRCTNYRPLSHLTSGFLNFLRMTRLAEVPTVLAGKSSLVQ
jgi:hypothetical protein